MSIEISNIDPIRENLIPQKKNPPPNTPTLSVKVCTGKTCSGRFSPYILKRLLAEKAKYDIGNKSSIEECTCQGNCKTGPVIVINNTLSDRLDPVKASNLYLEALKKK